jgi:hypothetical protein
MAVGIRRLELQQIIYSGSNCVEDTEEHTDNDSVLMLV